MPKERVFRKIYIFIVLVVAFLGYLIKVVLDFSPYEKTIIRKESIGDFNTLYVTEGSAGATTKNTYKYYLYPSVKTEKEFLADVRDYPSVLFTSDSNVQMQLKGRYLYFTVKGTIYSFTNQSDSVFIPQLNPILVGLYPHVTVQSDTRPLFCSVTLLIFHSNNHHIPAM